MARSVEQGGDADSDAPLLTADELPVPPPPGRARQAAGATFRSFRNRNFRLFFAGQAISQIGNWLTLVAQSLLVYELTDSGTALGFLAAAQFGPVLLFGAFAGLVADRSDKRRLLLVVQTVALVQSFALAALAFQDDPPIGLLYAVAVVGGLATAFDNPARRAFVVEMVPVEQVNNAVSLNSAMMTGARIVGPAVAGLLIATVGFGWCFVVDGLSYLAVLYGLWRIDVTTLRRPRVATRGKGQVRAGIRYAASVRELRVPLVMMAVAGTLAFNFQTVLPVFAERDLDGSDLTFTLLLSVISVGSLAGALAGARRESVEVRDVALAAVAFGSAMGLLALSPGLVVAVPVAVLVGLSSITFMTTSTSIVQVRAEESMRGRVLALQAIVFLGSTPIGGPMVGVVAEHLGARYALGVGAVATVAIGLWGLASAVPSAGVEGGNR